MADVYQHFRKDEAPFIAAFLDQIETAATEYRPVLTDFLDPRQAYIAQTLIGQNDAVRLHLFGGIHAAERVRGLIAPDYFVPTDSDYELAAFEIKYPEKFAELHHSQVLGTIANAGIAREQFGDILAAGGHWQLLTTASMADWVESNITRIGKIAVRLVPIDLDALVVPEVDWEAASLTMTSLRLDSLVGHAFNLSRARAKHLVDTEKVRLNFAETTAPDAAVGLEDIVSVRGFGRVRVRALLGLTKKGKQHVDVEIIHK
ncbi:RNA-binding protein [Lacticaseibacillus kribbianus]|uniref:YlmH family RNA-binding protein n=1 Tax=Lacticaseibacillus kribbianus TaxID=2926292 RepID=UPI001CD49568|nr:RNA-binding protein [Lacticaseibacillus kribbianus]